MRGKIMSYRAAFRWYEDNLIGLFFQIKNVKKGEAVGYGPGGAR